MRRREPTSSRVSPAASRAWRRRCRSRPQSRERSQSGHQSQCINPGVRSPLPAEIPVESAADNDQMPPDRPASLRFETQVVTRNALRVQPQSYVRRRPGPPCSGPGGSSAGPSTPARPGWPGPPRAPHAGRVRHVQAGPHPARNCRHWPALRLGGIARRLQRAVEPDQRFGRPALLAQPGTVVVEHVAALRRQFGGLAEVLAGLAGAATTVVDTGLQHQRVGASGASFSASRTLRSAASRLPTCMSRVASVSRSRQRTSRRTLSGSPTE